MPKAPRKVSLDLLFRALADSTRLRILHLMAGREICVCYFSEILRLPQPKVSRHLAYLRRTGLVAARREGKWMHYRLIPPTEPLVKNILRETLKHLRQNTELRGDIARLNSACCQPQRYRPQPAPRPALIHSG